MNINIFSWNVNGIRAAVKNGLLSFLQEKKPDILCLQEVKIADDARARTAFDFAGYTEYWHSAKRPGYAGTAILVREKKEISRAVIGCEKILGDNRFDEEGRMQTMEFKNFFLINAYFPNSRHELSRLDFKEEFNAAFLRHVKKLEKKKPVIATGDFNVAHQPIDLFHPKENEQNPGFTPQERAWADKFAASGLVDTFRHLHPKKIQYSWWSYRFRAREKNIGWRIDYFWVSKKLLPKVKKSFILNEIYGSDHCPIGMVLNNNT